MANYPDQQRILVAVDCIIFGFDEEELKILLIKRNFEPEKGSWSLMGGFLTGKETSDEAASRILKALTGIDDVYLEQVSTFTKPDRDPAERTISIAYYALINIAEHNEELIKKYGAKWFGLRERPPLIFDHNDMVELAVKELRHKTTIQPIGFELLPEKFTMRQLQKLYEAIFNEEMDKRNFYKKINQMNILIKSNKKDMTSSKRGSFLYSFDPEKYNLRLNTPYSFRTMQ